MTIIFFFIIKLLQQLGKGDSNLASPHKEERAMLLGYKALNTIFNKILYFLKKKKIKIYLSQCKTFLIQPTNI